MKLEFGGYKGFREGWLSVNIFNADYIHDLNVFPYPFADNSVDAIKMLHTLEHLDNPKKVMHELYRICKPDAIVEIAVPYWKKRSILRNPEHTHDFEVFWFRAFDKSTPTHKAIYTNMEHLIPKTNFKILSERFVRQGLSRQFWQWGKIDTIYITMKALK